MIKKLLGSLKIIIPLGLGLYLVWFFINGLSPSDKQDILVAFKQANYGWVLFSFVFAILSHMSRAYRWKYTLEPLGYKPDFWKSFMSVMIAYLVNMAVPRLGELSRCGAMAKYEGIPFNKLLGTVIAERVADMLILLVVITAVIFIQYEVIKGILAESLLALSSKVPGYGMLLILSILGVLFVSFIYYLAILKTENPIVKKVIELFKGIWEGLASIITMKNKWAFLGHTIFIWLMYLMMFYICFLALPQTLTVPFGGILTAFALGGITIAATNGGIGAYPLAIQGVLLLYGVDKNIGGAFGWITWSAQTVLLVVMGLLAFIILPIYDKKTKSL